MKSDALLLILSLTAQSCKSRMSLVSSDQEAQPIFDRYLRHAFSKIQNNGMPAHATTVTSLALSPDGRYLVSGSLDKTMLLWDLETKTVIATYRGTSRYPQGEVYDVGISDNLQWVAAGSDLYGVRLYPTPFQKVDVDEMQLGYTFEIPSPRSVVFSRDSAHLFASSRQGFIKDISLSGSMALPRLNLVAPHENDTHSDMELSFLGDHLITAVDNYIGIYSRHDGTLSHKIVSTNKNINLYTKIAVSDYAVSPTIPRLYAAGSDQGEVIVFLDYLFAEQKVVETPQWFKAHQGEVTALATYYRVKLETNTTLASTEFWLVSAGKDGFVRLWRSGNSSGLEAELDVGYSNITSMAMLPRGHSVILGNTAGDIIIWDFTKLLSQKTIYTDYEFGNSGACYPEAPETKELYFSGEGRFVVNENFTNQKSIFDLQKGIIYSEDQEWLNGRFQLLNDPNHLKNANASPDDSYFKFRVIPHLPEKLPARDARPSYDNQIFADVYPTKRPSDTAVTKDGKTLIAAMDNGFKFYDLSNLEERPLLYPGSRFSKFALSPDDNFIAGKHYKCLRLLWLGDLQVELRPLRGFKRRSMNLERVTN